MITLRYDQRFFAVLLAIILLLLFRFPIISRCVPYTEKFQFLNIIVVVIVVLLADTASNTNYHFLHFEEISVSVF